MKRPLDKIYDTIEFIAYKCNDDIINTSNFEVKVLIGDALEWNYSRVGHIDILINKCENCGEDHRFELINYYDKT